MKDHILAAPKDSLAFILVASYGHHPEHLEKLLEWLRENGD